MRRLTGSLALAAVAAGLAVAAPAGAAVRLPSGALEAGPELMGDEVVWAAAEPDGRSRVRAATRGRDGARTLVHLPFSDEASVAGPSLATSDAAWAAGYAVELQGEGPRGGSLTIAADILAAPRDGPLRRVFRCDAERERPAFAAVELSATAMATSTRCNDAASGVEVRTPPEAPAPAARLPGTDLRGLAGDFVAILEPDNRTVVIHDWRRGAEAYRVDVGRLGYRGDLALDADGTLAFAYGTGGARLRYRVAVASPGSPEPRGLALEPREVYGLRLAGGRLAFVRSTPDNRYEIGRFDLASGSERVLARGLFPTAFAFDGSRLAWATPTCRGLGFAFTTDLTRRREAPRYARCRRLPLLGAPVVRRGGVRLRFLCSGFSHPMVECLGRVSLRTRGGRLLVTRREADEAWFRRPGSAEATVRLNRRGRALLRGGRRVRAVVSVANRDILGRAERRRATVTLRR